MHGVRPVEESRIDPPVGGLSGVVPRGVMDQQAAEDEVRAGAWLRTGVATLIYVEEMHAA